MSRLTKEAQKKVDDAINKLVEIKLAVMLAEKMKNWTVEIGGEPVDIDEIDFEGEVICVNLHQTIKVVDHLTGDK